MAPFRSRLTATTGRPTIPVETYLRLMYLKHRYGLGYETLCKEVADSFTWRRFCRIALAGRVPDPSTLMKLTKRLGGAREDGGRSPPGSGDTGSGVELAGCRATAERRRHTRADPQAGRSSRRRDA